MDCTWIGGPGSVDDVWPAVELADVSAPSSLPQPLTANAAIEPRNVRRPISCFLDSIISRLMSDSIFPLSPETIVRSRARPRVLSPAATPLASPRGSSEEARVSDRYLQHARRYS